MLRNVSKKNRKCHKIEWSTFYWLIICCLSATALWKDETITQTVLSCTLFFFNPPLCAECFIFTLFCSLQWLRSLSSSRRAAEAHCAASLRMRLFMKLSDSFPVPTCSSRVPMSDWKTAWTTGSIKKTSQGRIIAVENWCSQCCIHLCGFCAEIQQQLILKSRRQIYNLAWSTKNKYKIDIIRFSTFNKGWLSH